MPVLRTLQLYMPLHRVDRSSLAGKSVARLLQTIPTKRSNGPKSRETKGGDRFFANRTYVVTKGPPEVRTVSAKNH